MSDLLKELHEAHWESPSWRLFGLCHQAATRIAALEARLAESERLKIAWFECHLAHQEANQSLGRANTELFKRAMDAERRVLSALESTPPAPKVTDALAVAHEALEAASYQILEDYRTWVADDKDAKPRYGQYPRYDQVNAAIRVVSEALTAAQEAGNP